MKRYYYIAFEVNKKKGAFWTYSDKPLMLTDALSIIGDRYLVNWQDVIIIYVQEISSEDYERAVKMIKEDNKNL